MIAELSGYHMIATLLLVFGTMGAISWVARRRVSTTLEFYLAGRRVGPLLNAFAICGDYFSAASFLGVAGAVYLAGLDGAWYATGFSAGFVVVALFLAAPLRRAGHFSVPDFLASRFASPAVRLVSVAAVELIVLVYLLPQMSALGLTWEVLVGAGFLGLPPHATGIALSTLLIALAAAAGGMRATTINQALQFLLLFFVVVLVAGLILGRGFSLPEAVESLSNQELEAATSSGTTEPLVNQLDPGRPVLFGHPGGRYRLGEQIALIVTLLLGTAGLPHVLSRYFAASSGRAARDSTVWVLALAAIFYFLAIMLGVAVRFFLGPSSSLAEVPEQALLLLASEIGGSWLLALVTAAALAAIFSTVAGLLIAASVSWGHDVYEKFLNPSASERSRTAQGRAAVVVTALLAAALGAALPFTDTNLETGPSVAVMVTWAFALAGSALTPAFLLGIWWKGMTAWGALATMLTGLGLSGGLLLFSLFGETDLPFALYPTPLAAPLAAVAGIGASLLQRSRAPARFWLRLHGTSAERREHALALSVAGESRK